MLPSRKREKICGARGLTRWQRPPAGALPGKVRKPCGVAGHGAGQWRTGIVCTGGPGACLPPGRRVLAAACGQWGLTQRMGAKVCLPMPSRCAVAWVWVRTKQKEKAPWRAVRGMGTAQ
ncbi:hypothetical protein CT3_34950 [Comamonas terrigena NBRC 13299]|nr:hypothetical protein CT3_34950 [Comamonas terrigena NBRC 13299]